MNSNIETILKNKIQNLGKLLTDNCNDDLKKQQINQKISNLKLYEILLFVSCLSVNNLDKNISQLLNEFNINNNEVVVNEIKSYLLYFIEVKNIINSQ